MEFQSTLSVRRATSGLGADGAVLSISIHALRKESDEFRTRVVQRQDISIHALRKESDGRTIVRTGGGSIFQSTLSVRRATNLLSQNVSLNTFQSTLSVRRATCNSRAKSARQVISIHALRKESDLVRTPETPLTEISIHALRKESDTILRQSMEGKT